MKKNISFVIIFAAIIYGLIQLHYCSLDKSVNISNIVNVTYSRDLKNGENIPFSQLVDIEYKKILPDSIDYETLRPSLILLAEEFDPNDPSQLDYFPNICINVKDYSSHPEVLLGYDDAKINALKSTVERNLRQTPYDIIEWKPIEKITTDKASGLKMVYKQKNRNNARSVNIIRTSALKNHKEIDIVMSVSDEDLFQWMKYYNEIISSINFK